MQHPSTEAGVVPDGRGLRVALIASRFNPAITGRLREGAEEALRAAGVLSHAIERYEAPGAFELPFAARSVARTGRIQAVVCLGCVIRGETPHFEYICSAVAHGLMQASLEAGVPMAFGVLTTNTAEQAEARSAAGASNKGFEAACAALEMAQLKDRLLGPTLAEPRG